MWREVSILLSLVVTSLCAQQNLVQNPGFESPLNGHWEAVGFSISRSSDAYNGSYALKCTGRMKNHYLGPSQLVTLTPGKMYAFTARLKQLNNMPGKLFQKYRANMQYQYSDNGEKSQEYLAYHTSVRSADGWFRMAAYFRAPTRALSSSKLKFQTPDISINFLLDDVSIVELPDLADWKSQADERIRQLRMGNIHFRFDLSPGINASDIDVKIDHVKHLFGWGTLVKDQWMIDSNHKHYQDMVYEYFNTATTQGLKWLFNKGTATNPDYSQAMACIDALKEKGMIVRAHNLFWGFAKNLPPYVLHMSRDQLNATVHNHLNYMINITKGKASHWDVMNELVHGQWFEEQFHDPIYSQDIFRQVKQLDPKPLLMLNDYSVIARPEIADAYLQQAQKFLAQGIPLDGLGLQGHFHDTVPDPQRILLYLDLMAQAGLPLGVTELDVWQQDPDVRADYYEMVLRVLFSHPAMHGIVFWGFWDQHVVDKRSSLVDGQNLTINAAGQRVFKLIKETWSTHVNMSLSASGTNFDLRGFNGDYEITVLKNGAKVKVVPFSLYGKDTTVNITVDSNIDLPPPGLASNGQRDSNGGYVMGTAASSSSSPTLTCTSYHGHQSDTGEGAVAESSCRHDDEVMTGCSSILKNHDWHRQGEQIVTDKGRVVCRAVDGAGTTGGVQAVARCCMVSGLTCNYRAAGPSPPGHSTTVDAQCLPGETPMGCASWGSHNHGGGVVSNQTACTATNNDMASGVYSYAACCSAPSLTCRTMTSPVSETQGSLRHVSCPSGFTLTGCNFASRGGALGAGSAVAGSQACQAYAAGSLSEGQAIQAVATCCRTS